MLPENHTNSRKGWIEVICGSMFSGKTEELLRRVRRAQIAKQKIAIFKPEIDVRYAEKKIMSHDANEMLSYSVESAKKILKMVNGENVVAIDEVQFFDEEITEVCGSLANKGVRVIAAGLDKDYLGNPFGPMPAIMASAEYVTKVHAVCVRCGALANFSHRISADESLIVLGERNNYEPLCRECFNKR